MQVLKKATVAIAFGCAVAGLAGCDRGSPAYQKIDELPYSKWEDFAQTLPLEERLDLHKEIMARSGHNAPMTISGAFNKNPEETYDAILTRIKSGDDSRYYLPILYEINRQDDFEICDQSDRAIIQNYIWDLGTEAVRPEDRADFYRC